MIRLAAAMCAAFCCLFSSGAFAADDAKQLIGSWKLTSFTLQIIGEDKPIEPYGPDAKGSMIATDSRIMFIITSGNRKRATNVAERAALLDTLLAYAGKYKVEGDRITVTVDASWNEIYTGASQNRVRIWKLDGDKLSLRSLEQESGVRPGKRIVANLTWEREK
jgi:hypothetical protein